jgi:hypothetical protein
MAFLAPAVCQVGCGAALAVATSVVSSPLVLGGVIAMAGYATYKTMTKGTSVRTSDEEKTTLKTSEEEGCHNLKPPKNSGVAPLSSHGHHFI